MGGKDEKTAAVFLEGGLVIIAPHFQAGKTGVLQEDLHLVRVAVMVGGLGDGAVDGAAVRRGTVINPGDVQNLRRAVQPVGRHVQDDVAGLRIGQAVFQADELVWRGIGNGEGIGEVNEETAVRRQTIPHAIQNGRCLPGVQVHEGIVRDDNEGETAVYRKIGHVGFNQGDAVLDGRLFRRQPRPGPRQHRRGIVYAYD